MAISDAVLCYLASLPPSGLTGVENYASCTLLLMHTSIGMSCSLLEHPCLHVFRKPSFIHNSKCPWSLFTAPSEAPGIYTADLKTKAVSSLFQLIYILLLCCQNRYTLPSHEVTGSLQIQCRICWYSYSTGILNYRCTLELSRKFFKKHQCSFPSPINASRITTSETKCPNTDRKFPGESGVSSLLRTFIILLKN